MRDRPTLLSYIGVASSTLALAVISRFPVNRSHLNIHPRVRPGWPLILLQINSKSAPHATVLWWCFLVKRHGVWLRWRFVGMRSEAHELSRRCSVCSSWWCTCPNVVCEGRKIGTVKVIYLTYRSCRCKVKLWLLYWNVAFATSHFALQKCSPLAWVLPVTDFAILAS